MCISDWSSDVCSSDLDFVFVSGGELADIRNVHRQPRASSREQWSIRIHEAVQRGPVDRRMRDKEKASRLVGRPEILPGGVQSAVVEHSHEGPRIGETGGGSCRERVCQKVEVSVVGVFLKKQIRY